MADHAAGVQCHQDPDGQIHATEHVAHGVAHAGGASAGRACDAHQAAIGLGNDVIAGALVLRTVAAEAGDSGVNDLDIDLLEHIVADAQLVHDAGAVVFHDHIRLFDHLEEHLLAFLRLQIQRYALLVAVDIGIVHAPSVLERTHGTGIVALAGHFDFDDVGAVVGKHHCGIGTGQHAGQVEDCDIT